MSKNSTKIGFVQADESVKDDIFQTQYYSTQDQIDSFDEKPVKKRRKTIPKKGK